MTRTDTDTPADTDAPADTGTSTDNGAVEAAETESAKAEEAEPAKAEEAESAKAEEAGTEASAESEADGGGEDDKADGGKEKDGKEKDGKEASKEEASKEEDGEGKDGEGEDGKGEDGKAKAAETSKRGAGKRAWARMPGRSRVGKAGLVKATVAVALVGSVITAGLQWYQADRAATRDAERQQVRASAAEFGEALLSYDHTRLQQARDRVLALASDDFAKTYDEAFTGGLEGVITKLKADATATVRSVYLGEIESGTARAVVVMDSEVKSTSGTRRVLGSYLDMRLTRRGEEWKITEVTSIGAANETMTDPKGEQKKPDSADPSPAPSP